MADTEDLVLRFIGLDLLSNVAMNVANSIDRLGFRFERMGAAASANYRKMAVEAQKGRDAIKNSASEMAAAEAEASKITQVAKNNMAMATQIAADHEVAAQKRVEEATARTVFSRNTAAYAASVAAQKQIETDARLTAMSDQKMVGDAERYTKQAEQYEKDLGQYNLTAMGKQKADQELTEKELQHVKQRVEGQQRILSSINRTAQASAITGVAMVAGAGILAAGLAVTTTQAARFQQQMLLIQTQTGGTAAEVKFMTAQVMDLAPQFGFTTDEAAKALYQVESLGLRGNEALTVFKAGMQGAKIGNADLTDTMSTLASIMASKVVPATTSAAQVMSLLDATVGAGKMTMQDLNAAFKSGIIGSAEAFGVSLTSVNAALATLTDQGMPAAQAGTRLRMSLSLLGAPSGVAQKQLKSIGLAANDLGLAMREHGLVGALDLLKEHLQTTFGPDAMSDVKTYMDILQQDGPDAADAFAESSQKAAAVISRAFGGGRSGAAIMTLIGNMDRLHNRFDQITVLTNSWDARWTATQKSAQFQLDQFASKWDVFVKTLGTIFLPIILEAASKVGDIIESVRKWAQSHEELIAKIAPTALLILAIVGGALILVGVLGVLGAALGSIALGLGTISGILPALLIIMALVATVVAIGAVYFKDLERIWTTKLAPAGEQIWNTLVGLYGIMMPIAKVVLPELKKSFDDLSTWFFRNGGMWDDLKAAGQRFQTWLQSVDFSNLVAWIAVYIPAGIRVLVDSFIVMVDNIKITLDVMTGVVKAAMDIQKGDFAQAGKDIKASWDQAGKDLTQVTKDQQEQQKAATELFSGDLTKKYNDLSFSIRTTMEDALNPLPQHTADKMGEMNTKLDDEVEPARSHAHRVGTAMGDGMVAGVAAKSGDLANAASSAVQAALDGARQKAQISSPSALFANQVGMPITQGIAMGITAAGDTATAATSKLLKDILDAAAGDASALKKVEDVGHFHHLSTADVLGIMGRYESGAISLEEAAHLIDPQFGTHPPKPIKGGGGGTSGAGVLAELEKIDKDLMEIITLLKGSGTAGGGVRTTGTSGNASLNKRVGEDEPASRELLEQIADHLSAIRFDTTGVVYGQQAVTQTGG